MTIKGVIDRLSAGGFTLTRPDPADSHRLLVDLTEAGGEIYARAAPIAREITAKTLAPLDESERATLIAMLRRIA